MREFDIIIIGGGHQGLTLGALLGKCGKRVVLFERNVEFGGGLCTQEPITPGVHHNLHSLWHRPVEFHPPFAALGLKEHVSYIEPPVQRGMPLKDGRALVTYQDLDKTCESIAQFSRKDAETYRGLYQKLEPFVAYILRPLLHCPPLPKAEREAIFAKTEAGREFIRLTNAPAVQVARDLFESEVMRAMYCFNGDIVGGITDDVPALLGEFVVNTFSLSRSSVCVGGSHNLGHALHKVFIMNGGTSAERCHVEKILIRKGRAVGVLLREGDPFPEREVLARDAVISAVDVKQTFLKLIDKEALPSSLVEKVTKHKPTAHSTFAVHLELKEPPHHTAAALNPDVDRAWMLNIGYETTALFTEHWRQIRAGELPTDPGLECACITLFDPSQAPPGRHTAGAWQFVPYRLKDGGPEAWDKVRWEYAERCIGKWRQYAPNLTNDNITGIHIYTPLDIERRHINMYEGDWGFGGQTPEQVWENRPLPELCDYRTPIKGLYLGGSCCHPRASISGAPAYNAAGVITEDLGIKRWWKPPQVIIEW